MNFLQVKNVTRYDLIPGLLSADAKLGVELGVWKGDFSNYILSNWNGELVMVDIWKPQPREVYFDIMNQPQEIQDEAFRAAETVAMRFGRRARIVRRDTVDAAFDFANDSIDFVYVDANHSYETTLADLNAWYPKIKSGGLFAGHDFLDAENCCGSRFGVVSALTEFTKDMEGTLRYSAEDWPNWWFIK